MTRVVRVRDGRALARCIPVLRQLRTHLTAAQCRARVQRQWKAGYCVVGLEVDGRVEAVAGYRVLENLVWGRFLYVDDLITRLDARSRGHGRRLLTWLMREASRLGCEQFHLDSGVQRLGAHRFYLKHGLQIIAHHFSRRLG